MKQETKERNHLRFSWSDHYASVASPTNLGGDSVKVINIDKNGSVIEDMSKVKLPKELQIKIIKIMRNGNKVN